MRQGRFPRYFTLDEARALLPTLRPLMQRIQALAHELGADLGQRDLMVVWRHLHENGGNPIASRLWVRWQELTECVRQVHATGALVKDLWLGLVDFPHWREGREVFLCWRCDEDDIYFWHELDAGYQGRQPL